jgi:hypothetical protein
MMALKATIPAREVTQGDWIETTEISGQVIRVRHARTNRPIAMITVSVESRGVTRIFDLGDPVTVLLED